MDEKLVSNSIAVLILSSKGTIPNNRHESGKMESLKLRILEDQNPENHNFEKLKL